MKCQEVIEALSDYIDDDVDADQGDEIDIHLESCPACKACLNTFDRTVGFCRDTTLPPLDAEAIEALAAEAHKRMKSAEKGE
jgi:anti-sigma factor RsiW